jgi:meso-butanediol dehydrogenase/(S,S)-butanediol dehydrogenase/diacetyl reductase
MGRLEGKIAIVTGGARGIGRGIALVLAREGADVAIADVDVENADRTASELQALGRRAVVVRTDVSDQTSSESCVAQAIHELGRLDILVNNAGVVGDHALSSAVTLDDWDACYQVNLKGTWIMSRAVVPHFKENGGGKIVNISSMAGRKGMVVLPQYSASKAGVISLTQSLANALGPSNINVNAICPGFLWTDMALSIQAMVSGNPDVETLQHRLAFDAYIRANCPLRREQWPEDIGQAVAFFASEDARNITGQSLNVDGGIELN